jgi:hypothetical protein
MNYAFLFDVPECEPYIPFPMKKELRKRSEDKGAFTMEQLKGEPYKCTGLDAGTPQAVIVTPDDANPAALGTILLNFVYEDLNR